MVRWNMVALTALMLFACTSDGDDTDVVEPGMPDPWDLVGGKDEACEGFEGTPYNGATEYFVGELDLFIGNGAQLWGYEYWV